MSTLIKEITLIKTEINQNSNKFWIGQLFDDGTVKASWGRVGYVGDHGKWSGGEKYLNKKIKEKIKKGYTELKIISNRTTNIMECQSSTNLKFLAKKQIMKENSLLDTLIEKFVNANVHKITTNTNITYNSNNGLFSTPLGIITREGLEEARKLLSDLSVYVRKKKYDNVSDNLLNQYLRIIPQNLGMKRFNCQKILPNENSLRKQNDLLDSLQSSYDVLKSGSENSSKKVNEETTFEVDFDILNDINERNRLKNFFERSKKHMHGYNHIHIKEIFIVNVHSMTKNFRIINPIKEVFHGTSIANTLSILKSGLKVSPPTTAKIAGKMWGNGLYGAINSTKSLGYSLNRWGQGKSLVDDSGWLFVCDFSMGNIYYPTGYGHCNRVPKEYDSLWATVKNTGLYNDELVIYNDNQCKIKYLLECK